MSGVQETRGRMRNSHHSIFLLVSPGRRWIRDGPCGVLRVANSGSHLRASEWYRWRSVDMAMLLSTLMWHFNVGLRYSTEIRWKKIVHIFFSLLSFRCNRSKLQPRILVYMHSNCLTRCVLRTKRKSERWNGECGVSSDVGTLIFLEVHQSSF